VIAVGVLLDTFLVRTYLVTSASVALRRRMWWPGALSREPAPGTGPSEPTEPPRQPEQIGTP
jgi:RND superfamily putative drug exporter